MQRSITAAIIASLALLGCEEKKSPPAPATKAPVTGLPTSTGASVPSATALKDQAVSAATNAYNASKKSVDDLVAKAAALPDTVKPTVDSAVANAKTKLADAEKALSDLKAATGDAWKSLSEQAAKSAAAVNEAVKAAMDKFPK